MLKIPYKRIRLDHIQPPPTPLRVSTDNDTLDELAQSLSTHGQLQPILVRRLDGRYQLIAGYRRYLAAKRLAWDEIDAKVLEAGTPEPEILALIENVQREQLTPLEEARLVYHQVIVLERDVDIIARRFGKSRQWIDRRLELAEYPQELKDAVHAGGITLTVAKEILRVADEGYRKYLIEQATLNGATGQTARMWADDWHSTLQRTGQLPTATPGPLPEYHQQDVGLGCGACGSMVPIAHLRPIYFCRPCLEELHTAQAAAAAAPPEAPP